MTVSAAVTHEPCAPAPPVREKRFGPLILGSLGVVFGDIGTSPLYAFKEAVHAIGGAAERASVMGIISLILWALILIVTLKYVVVLLRADNHGEGGTLSLMALCQHALGKRSKVILVLGVIGAALFYGDAAITPAISVMSAVEGLQLVSPSFSHGVMPIALVILLSLFLLQRYGTSRVSVLFAPVMLLWFVTLGMTGIVNIFLNPSVLLAFNPVYGARLLLEHSGVGMVILGAVFLSVTGAEALYTDLGHFGRRPIQFSWLGVVFPALALNYLGQGALVLARPETASNPFFNLMPPAFLLPFVGLATLATVIASQSVITGAHSMTNAAVQLGLMPRMEVRHTSEHHQGQIYLPRANLWLLVGVLFLVVMFPSSSRLASAYGIAVSGAMAVDTVMTFVVVWKLWRVRPVIAAVLIAPILSLDLLFVLSNVHKIPDGAWMPLVSGSILSLLMIIWVRGSDYLASKQRRLDVPLADLPALIAERKPARVQGTAVFLTADPLSTPSALLHNLRHNKVLHAQNVVLSVLTSHTPRVREEERITLTPLFEGFVGIQMRYGFMETPNVLRGLMKCRKLGWTFDVMETTFFLSRRNLKASATEGLPVWQDNIYITMAHNADAATDFFRLPVDHVMEVGTQVKI